ncbi:MAG: hypothetical protein IJ604_08295 [Prevotella sp.]|nr:hypothetical protein [Prevotella sp.]
MKKETKILTIDEEQSNLSRRFRIRGEKALNKLKEIPISNDCSGSQLELYDEIYVPNNIENVILYSSVRRISEMASKGGVIVICMSQRHGIQVRMLPFAEFTKSLPEYGSDLKPTGNFVRGINNEYSDVYNMVRHCSTELDVYNTIKGKTLRVVGHNDVTTARYNAAGQVAGIRTRKVTVFSFAKNVHGEKNIMTLSSYKPENFYKDYEIIIDDNTGKYGIRNNDTGNIVIKCVFDEIKWGGKEDSHRNLVGNYIYKDPEGYVRFYYKGETAVYRVDSLRT